MRPASDDVIVLSGLRVLGHHGVSDGEQDTAQPLEVDLEVHTDLRVAGSSDRLEDTIDYGALVSAAAGVVSAERHRLLERIAERIAEEVGADPRVTAVTVKVRKVRPPVAADLRVAAVRITRPGGSGPDA